MSKLNPFAHFFGLSPRGAKASEEEDDKDKAKRSAGPIDDDELDQENAKGKRADDDKSDPKDDDEKDDKEDGPDSKKGKKAKGKKADDDQPDSDAEKEDEDKAPEAVRADRERGAAIMAYGLKNGCAEQAAVLAFDTNMSRSSALNLLKVGGSKASGGGLSTRMSGLNHAQVGPEASGELPPGTSAMAAGIIKAGQ